MVDSEDSPATPRRLSDAEAVDATPSVAGGDVGTDADVAQISSELQDDNHDHPTTPAPTSKQRGPVPIIQHDNLNDNPWDGSELGSVDASSVEELPRRAGSPAGSVASTALDAPSIQDSRISSPGSSVLPSVASRPYLNSPTPSFRPFDRRFQSRISSSVTASPRASSPAFLAAHSRNASISSNFHFDHADNDTWSPPWEVVRWTRLQKLNGQAFSEAGKRNFGSPTCLAVSASVVLGTSKGIILVFDYSQNLKTIIGPGTKAIESGAITSIAISADHTTIAGGHANGDIYTWDTSRPARPFLTIPHLDGSETHQRNGDGHVPNVAVVHLGFLGTRHTALVSADDRGMAFSHLATRGTGALGRTVKTTRILGRYPDAPKVIGKPIKPSTVLAFSSLPLGNVERGTDILGLTAMLTPYLLVIVSTTPVAQTQHKSARPKDVAAHSAMTGCLAWFPAVKLKVADAQSGEEISKVKLAYCWSNVLTVLDVTEEPSDDADQPPTLNFKARSRWKCEEAIVAVQWLSRSVLTVLTISQRLIVLEDRTMRMTDAFDLLQRYIYHTDLFSKQLHTLVEQLDEEDQSMHGVVADAFYMSFKAYKGRIFLLGFNEVSLGALSNWADRLIAMMEHGDYLGAIKLATSYYTGDADKLTVGLPEDQASRHSMVKDKVMEIVRASLKYAFSQRAKQTEATDDDHLKQLAETCFTACLSVGNADFLLDDMYEWYEEADVSGIFLETLEPYILDQEITIIPPIVVKDLVNHYVSEGWESRLEEMICHMETATLDLDQLTLLCKQHGLYDALIYVWNRALRDYVTPLIDLLTLVIPLTTDGEYTKQNSGDDYYSINAVKIFPYLSYTLTGRVYPNEEALDEATADQAMTEIYWFFFCGQTIVWPKGSGKEFQTRPDDDSEPAYPYLRLLLKYDAPSFLSALNEAFEDPFLNDAVDEYVNGSHDNMSEEQIFRQSINRQRIIQILLDVMNPNDFAPSDTIYLDMFIARNLPKFPQYLLLNGATLANVLEGLCSYPGEDLAEDAQLSAEYLLSVYQPTDTSKLVPQLRKARFYRILKRIFKSEGHYGKLIDAYFEDSNDQEEVFECLQECLRSGHGAFENHQQREVMQAVERHARALLDLSPEQTADALFSQKLSLHLDILKSAEDAENVQYDYLHTLLEPTHERDKQESPNQQLLERYLQLMCQFDPERVSNYIGKIESADLRLDHVLPAMEETGVVDAAVILMARDGQTPAAMDRLIKHLGTLESSLQGVLKGAESQDSDSIDVQGPIEKILESLQKYVYVGIWLCKSQDKQAKRTTVVKKKGADKRTELNAYESLWLKLIEATVQLTRRISPVIGAATDDGILDVDKSLALLRSLVQHTFTSLLASTSAQRDPNSTKLVADAATNLSFLRILRAFLANAAASSPNLADLRGVLASIFSAYAYEESILRLSNRLLDRSLFVNVSQAVELRQKGWRPRGSTCEACGKRVWGPGVAGGAVFEAWEAKQAAEETARKEKQQQRASDRGSGYASDADSKGKGKGKGVDMGILSSSPPEQSSQDAATEMQVMDRLVLLACRHIYHQKCLESLQEKGPVKGALTESREFRCPIDG